MSSPPTSSSSALPSPSRRTVPVSSWSAACVVFGPGQIQAVPEASHVSTAHVSPAVWSQALQRAQGPPTLAWCQANGPCSCCAWRNADCIFEGPQTGSRRDSAVCEACQGKHEGCSVVRLWRVCCMSAEQGWGLDWVWRKTGKGPCPQVVEVLGGGPTAVEGVPTPVGTPCLRPDMGKRKAVSESEAPKRVRRRLSLVPPTFEGGPLGLNIFSPGLGRLLPSITICQGPLEISQAEVCWLREEVEGLREEVRVARQERDEVAWAWDTLVRDRDASFERWEAQDQEINQLQARLAQGQVSSSTGALGFTVLSAREVEELARSLQATEAESHQQEWLLREVAGTRLEVLGWAREHRLLLDGLSSSVSFVAEELAGHAVTPGVAQGVGRLSRLMEAHRHRTSIEPGSWLKAFVDGLRTPPTLEETVEVAWELLESEFGPGGGQGEPQEGGST
ncbi:hypothetical protein C0992_002903 [Termitomyces sp. T32_za158]|nr:hypothetical protein C0992_002903 [Termitomyces sp. T32_za158]